MAKKTDFQDFEEARLTAGLFFARLLAELDINERTYYRWKLAGKAPNWAMRIVELLSGDLEAHGWKHWYIKQGTLYNDQLNTRYHQWRPETLLAGELYGLSCGVGSIGLAANAPDTPTRETGLISGEEKTRPFTPVSDRR